MDARERVQLSASRLHPGPAFFQVDQYLSIVKGTGKKSTDLHIFKKENFMKLYFIGQKVVKLTNRVAISSHPCGKP